MPSVATSRRVSTVVKPKPRKPRILLVTPEISSLPNGLESPAPKLCAKAGGLADVAALLMHGLSPDFADVHVALPHYRRIFHDGSTATARDGWRNTQREVHSSRVHLAEDRSFYYRDRIYSFESADNPHGALAFQREVINHIIPRVQPDLIHCHDWMTGLLPAVARKLNIPCLFTIHNVHSEKVTLAYMEHLGIDAAEFWESLYFDYMPHCYEESRERNPADMLMSGIFSASFVNTVSPTFLDELIHGYHEFASDGMKRELAWKCASGCARGILNTPEHSFDPSSDRALAQRYGSHSAFLGKAANKRAFQERTGLALEAEAPLFFWPSRLDPVQKGCQLLADILYDVVAQHADCGLQIAFVADGSFQCHFRDIVAFHGLEGRVAVCDYDEGLSRLGYAGSDFTLMPSRFEPCGLSQMIAALYGSLPIVHLTGGLRDTIQPLNPAANTGNGFAFETFDTGGLRWAMGEALRFYQGDRQMRIDQISRVMRESVKAFHPNRAVRGYVDVYEQLLAVPDHQRWRGLDN